MIKEFCDICEKEITNRDDLNWLEFSWLTWNLGFVPSTKKSKRMIVCPTCTAIIENRLEGVKKEVKG